MNGLTSIEINGQTIGLKFGLEANRIYLEYVAGNIERLNSKIYNERDIATLIYAGYKNFCTVNDMIPDEKYSIGKLIGVIEDTYGDMTQDIERVATIYAESKHTKQTIANMTSTVEDIKKKTTLTGSLSSPTPTENLVSEVSRTSLT